MIKGIGIDMIRISRINKVLTNFPTRFVQRVLHPLERPTYMTSRFFAKRWAAKEAASKALGLGIGKELSWHSMYVQHSHKGQPQLVFIAPPFLGDYTSHLSLTDDGDWVVAVVVIEQCTHKN